MSFVTKSVSPSGRYAALYGPDISETADEMSTTYSYSESGVTERTRPKYGTTRIVRLSDNHVIYEYKFWNKDTQPFSEFVTVKEQEWWFSGRHYCTKLFVNCETGLVKDQTTLTESDAWNFIWTGPLLLSPDNNEMRMIGCMWGAPPEVRQYDIRDLPEVNISATYEFGTVLDNSGWKVYGYDAFDYFGLSDDEESDEERRLMPV